MANARDLGGIAVTAGRLRSGLVFRSAALGRIADPARLPALGVGTVFDLRSRREISREPDQLPAGVAGVHLDVLGDRVHSAAGSLGEQLAAPRQLRDELRSGAARRRLRASYRDIVMLPSAQRSYSGMFQELLGPEGEGEQADGAVAGGSAVLFHCQAGKDRTGWAAAALLSLLGADRDDVYEDYLQTNADFVPSLATVFDRAQAQGIEPELLLPVLGVEPDYLDYAFATVDEEFGSLAGYFSSALGFGPEQQQRLRARLVD